MSERKFKETLTIGGMKEVGIEITEFFDTKNVPMKLDWDLLLKLCNAMILEGPPISDETPFKEALDVIGKALGNSFL